MLAEVKSPMSDTNPSPAPAGYSTVQPYLMFVNAAEAKAWYGKIFGATEKLLMKDDTGRIVHAEIVIGGSVIMIADENPTIDAFAPRHYGGSPVSLMVYVENSDATYKTALDAGAISLREPTDQPYGDRMAGVLDPFGYKWWIAHSLNNGAERGVDK